MKAVLAVMVLAVSALAQGPPIRSTSACGIKDVSFQREAGYSQTLVEPAGIRKSAGLFHSGRRHLGPASRLCAEDCPGWNLGRRLQEKLLLYLVSKSGQASCVRGCAVRWFCGTCVSSHAFHGRGRKDLLLPHSISQWNKLALSVSAICCS
jgi:hypothetical protein